MNGVIYEKAFCRERCIFYKQFIRRVEGYNMPGLIEHQEQKISPYCVEHCKHTRDEFDGWRKAKKLSPLVKKLFGVQL
jgi:hypothetical protein